ncbi:MAG TPA: VOC family protein [Acidimicrobiales bacterium]|nr:VOC family protein [Acidimicrobiales bacterium]
MPKRDQAPNGAPCWVDLYTEDPERATAFYTELFGWTAESSGEEYGGYINFLKDGVLVAGCARSDPAYGGSDAWSLYLATDDAEKTVQTAVAAGATVVAPAMAVGPLGSMAMLNDVGQAAIGAWQPGTHKGFGVLAEPGTPSWFELHTRDYEASVRFYQDVFGWETSVMSDEPDFRYTTLGEGWAAAAGIMDSSAFLPEGTPAHWSVYFGSADTDATVARVVELGGSVLDPAQDSPYGRLALVADPTGAAFRIVTPPQSSSS